MVLITVPRKEKKRRRKRKISAHADGGPCSRVCSRNTPAQPPIDMSGIFPAHVSIELPSTISPDWLELFFKVSKNIKNFKKEL